MPGLPPDPGDKELWYRINVRATDDYNVAHWTKRVLLSESDSHDPPSFPRHEARFRSRIYAARHGIPFSDPDTEDSSGDLLLFVEVQGDGEAPAPVTATGTSVLSNVTRSSDNQLIFTRAAAIGARRKAGDGDHLSPAL